MLRARSSKSLWRPFGFLKRPSLSQWVYDPDETVCPCQYRDQGKDPIKVVIR